MALPRVIMHVDLDYFFAQVEEVNNPNVKGKPVIVCVYSGRTADSGAVSTANYLAREVGIRSGMPIILAKRMVKDREAVFLPVNHSLYKSVSDRVMELLRENSDRFEQVSIDEAYLDASVKTRGDFKSAARLASDIKKIVREKEGLTCSIGVGPNKLVAKIASDFKKPDGLTVVRPDEVTTFIAPLPVDRIPGIGKKTETKMKEIGIRTVEDLAGQDHERLRETFGEKLGTYFLNSSRGMDDEPVQEREMAEQLSRIITLKQNTRDLALILGELPRIVSDIEARLQREELASASVGVILIDEKLEVHTRSKKLDNPTASQEEILVASKDLIEKFLNEEPDTILRRVGIKLSDLARKGEQKSLGEFLSH